MTASFADTTALVTGATSGIGRAIAVALGAAGAAVVVTGRNEAEAEVTVAQIEGTGGRALAVVGDVTDSAFADEVVTAAEGWPDAPPLGVVVNAAGVIVRADAVGTDDDAWRRQMAVNVDGVFYVSRAAIPTLRSSGGGSIINLSSTCGLVGSAGLAGYCASKAAVIGLTKGMALDHAAEGIRINAVCPGAVDTPMLRSAREQAPMAHDEILDMNVASIPQGRVPMADEIAELVVFLAGDGSRHITGTAIPIDGGYTAA